MRVGAFIGWAQTGSVMRRNIRAGWHTPHSWPDMAAEQWLAGSQMMPEGTAPSECARLNLSSLVEFDASGLCNFSHAKPGGTEEGLKKQIDVCRVRYGAYYEHPICIGGIDRGNCLSYDFGIRIEPHFGMALAKKFRCEVHAFDPSPMSVDTKVWIPHYGLQHVKSYHYSPVGTAGHDGALPLLQYNWGQVSVYGARPVLVCNTTSACAVHDWRGGSAAQPTVEVRTLGTLMRERRHAWVDVLKIDVEGSEWGMLEQIFSEFGCPPAGQLTVEFHHYGGGDPRYGVGSSPYLRVVYALLASCGFTSVHQHSNEGWAHGDSLRDFGTAAFYQLISWIGPNGGRPPMAEGGAPGAADVGGHPHEP